MQKAAKLPNGNIVFCEDSGHVTVRSIPIELSFVISADHEDFLDHLSEKAVGSDCLSDISYRLTGTQGDALLFDVTGDISDITGVDIVDADTLPMQVFAVTTTRTSYGSRTAHYSARTESEATNIADDDAGNHLYDEHHAEYSFEASPAHC